MDIPEDLVYITLTEHLEFLDSLLVLGGILSCRIKKRILPYILASAGLTLLLACMILCGYQKNLPPICFLAELVLIWYFVQETFFKKITMYIISYIFNYVVCTLVTSLLSLLSGYKESVFWSSHSLRILIILISISIAIVVISILKRFRKPESSWARTAPFRYLALSIPGLLCCALVISFVQMSRSGDPVSYIFDKIAVFSVTLICVVYSVGTVLFIWLNDTRKNYRLQNQLKDMYLNILKSYYKNMLENDQELRRFRHDLKAYIGCMRVLAEQEKYEELVRYIRKVSSEADGLTPDRIHCGNDIVDAMMNYLLPIADKEGIRISLEGTLPSDLEVADIDLCTILSNAIINAIDACREAMSKKDITIGVTVGMRNGMLYLSIENPVSKPVDISILGKGTIKRDKKNHGFGIRNLLEAAERNHGQVRFSNLEGSFLVEVFLQTKVLAVSK